jgi:hypothetical protein
MQFPARLAIAGSLASVAAIAATPPPGPPALAQGAGTDAAPPPIEAPAGTGPIDEVLGHPLPPGVGPIVWAEARGRDCHRYAGRMVCEGPRRVPVPRGDSAERVRTLRLDERRCGHRAIAGEPPAEWVAAAPGPMGDDLLWPVVGGRLWRGFGIHHRLARTKQGTLRRLRSTRRHEGVDIGAHEGTPMRATNPGLVVYSDNGMRGYGNAIVIVHADASVTMYAHCRATFVAAGDLVARGQTIAEVGDTGLAHGAHLHFEWRIGGRVRDPLQHFAERPERGASPDHEAGSPEEEEEQREPGSRGDEEQVATAPVPEPTGPVQ